jgi:RimJ/RimL family protein N-acetyltransferase
LINYIQLAVKARESKTEFPLLSSIRKLENMQEYRFYGINQDFKTLQLGYTWYGAEFRGTGLNKHCKFLLLQFAFEELGMERVEFRADNKNVRSIAAMKSIGCKEEGILRNHMPTFDNTRRDTIILSILSSEWFDAVKANLIKSL